MQAIFQRLWPVVLLGVVGWTTALGAAEVRLRSEMQASGGLVLLRDVAEVFAKEHDEMQRLAEMELFPAPLAGEKRLVSVREIRDMLVLKGLNIGQVRFSGASQTRIIGAVEANKTQQVVRSGASSGARRLATDRVSAALVAYLNTTTGSQARWIVRFDLNDEQVAMFSDPQTHCEISGGESPWVGRQMFQISKGLAAESAVETTLEVDVTLPATIVVAARTLPRGAVVHAADLQVQASRPHEAQLESFGRLEDVVGQELRRSIGAGQPLTQADVQPPVLVRRGDPVTVYARSPGIQVRTTARAVEDGALGDLISVESLSDRRRFFASVSGIQEVEIYARAAAADTVRPVAASEVQPVNFRGP